MKSTQQIKASGKIIEMKESDITPAASPSVTIEWATCKGVRCLQFTFQSVLTHEAAIAAAGRWRDEFKNQQLAVPVIFNCLKMTDYHPMARSCWQKVITEQRSVIQSIWVVTNSKVIRAGAAILSLFTRFDLHTVDTEEKIFI